MSGLTGLIFETNNFFDNRDMIETQFFLLIIYRILINIDINKGKTVFFFLQLRQLIFNFAQKELAPRAAEIDKKNNFDELRVSKKKKKKKTVKCF